MAEYRDVVRFWKRVKPIADDLKRKIARAKQRGATNRSPTLQTLLAKRNTLQRLLAIFDATIANLDDLKNYHDEDCHTRL